MFSCLSGLFWGFEVILVDRQSVVEYLLKTEITTMLKADVGRLSLAFRRQRNSGP
jgi:hypothetical protein